ncbi:PREDICTED: uncharacterized protein LOC104790769 [Camelina sativa]|uniref:Uncharacterized protein LOC104790769 n=1 Tax=Camelina sativa TaxID=90675 RepID=A0ABM1RSQ5_CAMSA|nr:PREDICTED: uncharacterized protein LOC104790769 [Camelina sativa]
MGIKPKHKVVFIIAIMLMVSLCLAARNILPLENNQGNEIIYREILGKEEESAEKIEHPRSSVENHHYIPRQDFNNYGPGGDNNGGGG